MRYILVSLTIGLLAPLSGCMSDNYDYVTAFQPSYYGEGISFNYATGQKELRLRELRGAPDRDLRR